MQLLNSSSCYCYLTPCPNIALLVLQRILNGFWQPIKPVIRVPEASRGYSSGSKHSKKYIKKTRRGYYGSQHSKKYIEKTRKSNFLCIQKQINIHWILGMPTCKVRVPFRRRWGCILYLDIIERKSLADPIVLTNSFVLTNQTGYRFWPCIPVIGTQWRCIPAVLW